MPSLYAEFLLEYDGTEIIENEQGFATYRINDDECYIENVYVRPEFRKLGIHKKLSNDILIIAKERGCKYLSTGTCTKANNPIRSMKVILDNGFNVDSVSGNMIYYRKDI